MNTHVLYHICLTKDKNDYTKGYLGVTNNFSRRMYQYKDTTRITSPSLRLNMEEVKHLSKYIVLSGSKKFCSFKERQLRSKPNMGWNKNPGGGGNNQKVVKDEIRILRLNKDKTFNGNPRSILTYKGSLTKRLNHRLFNKKVVQVDKLSELPLFTWKDVFTASDNLGIPTSDIIKCIEGKRKSSGNYKWKLND